MTGDVRLTEWKQDLEDIVQFALKVAMDTAPDDVVDFMKEASIECRAMAENIRNQSDVGYWKPGR